MKKYIVFLLAALVVTSSSCKKYLDEKSDQKLVVPSNVPDVQAMMDNYLVINQAGGTAAAEKSADDYYVTTAVLGAVTSEQDRRTYTWEKDNLFVTGNANDWAKLYARIYIANTALDALSTINRAAGDEVDFNAAQGHALFVRGYSLLQAAGIFCLAYDSATAESDLGLPLRLDPDFNKVSIRSSVARTYQQILIDLKQAAILLPVINNSATRPVKATAYAAVARTYLYLRNYDSAANYASLSLQSYNTLLDYNNTAYVSTTASFGITKRFNPEELYDCFMSTPAILTNTRAIIDSNLYASYNANDLRKTVFFRSNGNGTYGFKGSYIGNVNLYDGITVAEMYLTRAECLARKGDITGAMSDVNTVLQKRFKAGTYVALTANSANDAVTKVLAERRKELVMRGLRWMDVKRLNKDGAGIVLTRNVNNQTYTLAPNDPRYALPIPDDVINISGMKQNPR